MEIVECDVELLELIISDDIAACDVAEFKECSNRLDNLGGNESLDGIHINLTNYCISRDSVTV